MNRIDYAKEKPEFIAGLRAITRQQKHFRLDANFWNRMAGGFLRMPEEAQPQP